jgi:3-oxoacyl-[acyl-carrier-protein] synthase-3
MAGGGNIGSVISGWGMALPERVLSNRDLEQMMDTSDQWITERTGIKERRIGETTSGLSVKAATAALKIAKKDPSSIGALVLSTTTQDKQVPATSSKIHSLLSLGGFAFDLNAACAGFVYATVVAHSILDQIKLPVLVIGADVLSQITDYSDRSTAILFGDAAGAILLEPSAETSDCLLSWDLGVDGALEDLLYCDRGGFLKMSGQEVFKIAVRVCVSSAKSALEKAGITANDIAYFVPHQANKRIIDAVIDRLGIDKERTNYILKTTGNTSSASIGLGIADAADRGILKDGDLILLSGFGAGMTWASAVLRWGR